MCLQQFITRAAADDRVVHIAVAPEYVSLQREQMCHELLLCIAGSSYSTILLVELCRLELLPRRR